MTEEPEDLVSNPNHYKSEGELEVINVIETFNLPFHLACALRYICRHEGKGGQQDLRKAIWYIARYLYIYYCVSSRRIFDLDIAKPLDAVTRPPKERRYVTKD